MNWLRSHPSNLVTIPILNGHHVAKLSIDEWFPYERPPFVLPNSPVNQFHCMTSGFSIASGGVKSLFLSPCQASLCIVSGTAERHDLIGNKCYDKIHTQSDKTIKHSKNGSSIWEVKLNGKAVQGSQWSIKAIYQTHSWKLDLRGKWKWKLGGKMRLFQKIFIFKVFIIYVGVSPW